MPPDAARAIIADRAAIVKPAFHIISADRIQSWVDIIIARHGSNIAETSLRLRCG